jgi:hypothetical protein
MSTHCIRLSANHSKVTERVVVAGYCHVNQQYFGVVFDPKLPSLAEKNAFRCLQKLREFIDSHALTVPDAMLEAIFEDSVIQEPQRYLTWTKEGAIVKASAIAKSVRA